jgi:hypothetical protein
MAVMLRLVLSARAKPICPGSTAKLDELKSAGRLKSKCLPRGCRAGVAAAGLRAEAPRVGARLRVALLLVVCWAQPCLA